MMILIADSGSTKTDWVLIGHDGEMVGEVTTAGMNPYHLTDEELSDVLKDMTLLSSLGEGNDEDVSLFFYGSGCTPEQISRLCTLLQKSFPQISSFDIQSDLMGAARALCGHQEGIACILGTGANSCLYDGERIVQNTPALGYILGDEGSGAVLGRNFLNALYKGRLSQGLREAFEQDMSLTMSAVIQQVYREPMANCFLASLSLFIWKHLDVPEVRQLVVENFREFLRNNVKPYGRPELPIGFVGSMAYHYESELREAVEQEGLVIGKIMKRPVSSLIRFCS
jgi:N-acetylglucosamine kinase-like BadF-type ATPase